MTALAALVAGLWFAGPILAAPLLQGHSAEIDDIRLRGEDAAGESVFAKGDLLFVEIDVEDTRDPDDFDDDETLDYVVVLNIEDRDNDEVVYSTNDIAGENKEVTLGAGDSEEVTFRWDVAFDIDEGSYRAMVSVRHADDFSFVVDDDFLTFRVIESGNAIFLSTRAIDFGDVVEDETPSERIIVANTNRDAGDLKWKITEWPDEWLELVEPPINISSPWESVTVTNTGGITLRVRESALLGSFNDDVRIESNAGNAGISVRASIDRDPKGEITRLRVQNSSYKPGDEVTVEYRILNDGGSSIEYLVIFSVQAPSNAIVYNSNLRGEDATVLVESGESSEILTFSFMLPFGISPGEYLLTAELRSAASFDREFHEISADEGEVFEVERGPIISVSPPEWPFGTVVRGENPEARFDVSNIGRDTLTWEVVSWPEWLELLSPTSETSGPGTIRLKLKDSAPTGISRGTIEIDSNGGPRTVNVSANVPPPPMPTVGAATVLARLATPTPTPPPTPTPTPLVPTPTPSAVLSSTYSGSINLSGGAIPEGARLVVKVRDYVSPPAAIEGTEYFNLVAAPPDSTYVGEPLEFILNGTPSAPLSLPVFFFPGSDRTVDLSFRQLSTPAPTATLVPPTPTSIPSTPTPTLTPTSTPIPPTATPNPIPSTATPSPSPSATSVPLAVASPGQTSTPETEPEAAPSGGGCRSIPANVPPASGMANLLLMFAPIGLVVAFRARRRGRGR